jgi:hypothetical protein
MFTVIWASCVNEMLVAIGAEITGHGGGGDKERGKKFGYF